MNSAQERASRALDYHDWRKPLVILTDQQNLQGIINIVAVSLPPGSKCHGHSWVTPEGKIVSTKLFWEKVPDFAGGFDMVICNGGRAPTETDLRHIQNWRKAANA